MRFAFLVIACLFTIPSFSQEKTFTGKVIDKDSKEGVPFCVVKVKDRNEGAYSDETGKFSFTSYSADSVKAFQFYCLGFGKLEVPTGSFSGDNTIIELKKEIATLNEVVFTGETGNVKKRTLGKRKMKYFGDCYQKYGEEIAVFLPANKLYHGYLKDVFVYITDEGVPTTKFRIHVYEKDPVTNLPAKELTDSNLIVHAINGSEWVKASLHSKRIPVGSGVFISVEWVAGHGNVDKALQSSKHTEVSAHNGQVLGLTKNYGIRYMYHRKPFQPDWGFDFDKSLCPMIYGTFTYVKK